MSIKINELPKTITSNKDLVKFRSCTSSANYNQLQENIFFDIMNMYNNLEQFDSQLTESNELVNIDTAYTQLRLIEMKNEILQEKQKNINLLNNEQQTIKLFPYNFKIKDFELHKADINKKYDQVNIPISSKKSKLFLYDEAYDMITIPKTFNVKLTPETDNIKVFDTDFKNALTDDLNKAWVRKIIDNNASFVETEIEITLPDNIISNRDINSLEITPFPYSSIDVLSIEYKLNGNWEPLPGFTHYKNSNKNIDRNIFGNKKEFYTIQSTENIKLCFNKTAMSKIKIKLRQDSFIEENGNRIFYLGLKNFQLSYETVTQKYCNFYAEINFDDNAPRVLSGIMPKFNNSNILSDKTDIKTSIINYELYSVNENGDWDYINNSFPIFLEKTKYILCIKMIYDEANDINPSLRSLDVLYYNKKKNRIVTEVEK